jgi:hypothetical protein
MVREVSETHALWKECKRRTDHEQSSRASKESVRNSRPVYSINEGQGDEQSSRRGKGRVGDSRAVERMPMKERVTSRAAGSV